MQPGDGDGDGPAAVQPGDGDGDGPAAVSRVTVTVVSEERIWNTIVFRGQTWWKLANRVKCW
ncbi:hypothetical protein KJZ99_00015 [bacterium]|nr:hypothetical protein [bacterium]